MQHECEEKLASLPAQPGVYLLKDKHAKVIYVGKAKNLRSRVRSYFRGGDERVQVRFLVQRVTDFETLVTSNDKEALILENNLIKQYKPRYNIRLKDDKSYVSVKVTVQQDWPRIVVTRKIVKDGSRYFGPFSSASGVRETLDTIRKVIPLRTCSDGVFRNRSRPCLEYQIKRCLAPCCLPVDADTYQRHLREAMLLLEGKNQQLVRQLRDEMSAAASDLRFEDAARLRDQIRTIEKTQEPQQVLSHWGGDQDIFGLYREGGFIEAQVLFIRSGKLTGNQAYHIEDYEFSTEEVLEDLLTQFYQGDRYLPDEILLPVAIEDADTRAEYLSERRGRRVEFLCPQRGDKVRLVAMATENARQGFRARQDGDYQRERMLEELRTKLHLRNAPKRIECFDISNIQGTLAVGSMVTFDEGEPDKNRYRRFRIRTVEGADDFRMMYEVLTRRYRRAKEKADFPDLLVVDGGIGQLNVALEVLRELEITEVDAAGLAKMRVERDARAPEIERSEERVFLPGRKNPVVLRRNSSALFLLQRVRDEAHRFAITYHRALRRKERLRSLLDGIPGIGATRRKRLLRHFGSVRRMRDATAAQLAEVSGISSALAESIERALAGSNATATPAQFENEN
ncbi:MAG: excinuclease ABC subunit UvrC [Deltaproteobacteria bacterium]|nr:excinuclease ABC subunit UvrC [Deltaproteobacteria bacterium]MBI3389096.1 excinuclease ABC subunit UvrC [Deltaproteobacteria bacterium]